jgi:hypothetical protein
MAEFEKLYEYYKGRSKQFRLLAHRRLGEIEQLKAEVKYWQRVADNIRNINNNNHNEDEKPSYKGNS